MFYIWSLLLEWGFPLLQIPLPMMVLLTGSQARCPFPMKTIYQLYFYKNIYILERWIFYLSCCIPSSYINIRPATFFPFAAYGYNFWTWWTTHAFTFFPQNYESLSFHMIARDNLLFLHNWFLKFPHYKDRNLYITGESYAGTFIDKISLFLVWIGRNWPQL